jgi:predicted O-linked N-acetylglucosamine transferase (SPINDLY family)
MLEEALASHEAGDAAAAARLYAAVLERQPGQPSALHNLAVLRAAEGRLDEAISLLVRAADAAPDLAQIHCSLAGLHLRQGRTGEAATAFQRALELDALSAPALTGLADIAAAEGSPDDARGLYDRALAADPNHLAALTNSGVLLMGLGRAHEAGERFALALALEPGSPGANYNVANALRAIGRPDEARAYFEQALALAPGFADAWTNLGNLKRDEGDLEGALVCHREAVRLKPGRAGVMKNLGHVLRDRGDASAAREAFTAASALDPADIGAALSLTMAELPLVYADEAGIEMARSRYEERLAGLASRRLAEPAPEAWDGAVGSSQPFYLAYQGRDDRDLQRRYGELVCAAMAECWPEATLPPPPMSGEKVRVGIVSGFFCAHSNWKIPIRGWVRALDRARFEVSGYHTGAKQDAATAEARELCDRFVQGPLTTEAWREKILADAPHVLIYPEIGMDPMCARLAALRLARAQCASWGHPDTTGYPTLDWFLSSDAMEPRDAGALYTERLVRLPELGLWCEPDRDRPDPLDRTTLGYRASATVFWCGQSLPKYLPRFDGVFPQIAEGVGDCQFVFIDLPGASEASALFRRRIAAAFAARDLDPARHVLFLPRLGKSQFLGALAASDVFLDSLEWSGCNSTLESLAFDLPIATLRGRYMRGRHTAAILEVMGLGDLVSASVEDFVAAAVRLGVDPAWRASVRARIESAKPQVWESRAAIAALEDFLERAARAEAG